MSVSAPEWLLDPDHAGQQLERYAAETAALVLSPDQLIFTIAGRSGFEMNALDALILPGIKDTKAPVVENVEFFLSRQGLPRAERKLRDEHRCQYCGDDLPIERKAHHIAFAEGRRGACRDYLANTAAHARALHIHDPYIEELVERVSALRDGTYVIPTVQTDGEAVGEA